MAGERILVVEDEANIVNLVRAYLEREGFTVDAVTVMFRNPATPVSQLGIPLDVTSVTDLNPAPAGTAVAGMDTRFLIHFNPIKALLEDATIDAKTRLERERALFALDHAAVGRMVAQKLELPDLFVDAVAFDMSA